jgi:hypothetical protein
VAGTKWKAINDLAQAVQIGEIMLSAACWLISPIAGGSTQGFGVLLAMRPQPVGA